MKRLIFAAAALLLSVTPALAAQQSQVCYADSSAPPVCINVSAATPLPVTTSSPSGTQDANIKQVNGNTVTTIANGEQKVGVEGPVAAGAAAGGNPVPVGGDYNTTPPTLTNGNRGTAQVTVKSVLETTATDVNGNVIDVTAPVGVNPMGCSTSACGIVVGASTAVEIGHVICAAACNSYDVAVTTGASAVNLMMFNATSVPVDGAVTPKRCEVVPANSTFHSGTNGSPPSYWSTGLSVAISTAAGSAACLTKTGSNTGFYSWKVSP